MYIIETTLKVQGDRKAYLACDSFGNYWYNVDIFWAIKLEDKNEADLLAMEHIGIVKQITDNAI